MKKSAFVLGIVLLQLVVALVCAKPYARPEKDDSELLVARDTLPYIFWWGRPYYELDFEGADDRRSPNLSPSLVGSGWGR